MSCRLVATMMCLALLVNSGCNQGQFGGPNQSPFAKNNLSNQPNIQGLNSNGLANNSGAADTELANTIQELNNKLSSFDSSNQELHTEIAQLKRSLAVSQDEKNLLKQQMADTLTRYKKTLNEKSDVEQRLTAIQASARTQSSAEIRANNSLLGKLQQLNLSGIEVVEDGDVIRIYLPSDKLFQNGTYAFQKTGQAMLDQVALELKRHFSNQIIGIEGHVDDRAIVGQSSTHQVSATQALAVFDYYRKAGNLSNRQMFILGHGANRPRYSNASPQGQAGNRRIELVIYPETVN